MRVLVVEDDDRLTAALRAGLQRHGFEVSVARTAGDAMARVRSEPDVVLLDLGLPDQDGMRVCARIRELSDVPVIMVTARADVRSRVHGLNLGADDYLVKPFDFAELFARVRAVTRRVRSAESEPGVPAASAATVVGRLHLDRLARRVLVDGRPLTLTRKEFDLLALLAERPGVVCRREHIISRVWGTDWAGTARTLEVHVASLRSKLHVDGMIETVRGIGYRLSTG